MLGQLKTVDLTKEAIKLAFFRLVEYLEYQLPVWGDAIVGQAEPQAGCHVPFTEEWVPSGHSTMKAWLVECWRDGCPSGRFSHLQRGTLELCQSDHRVLGHLPDQGPSPPFAQFGRAASSRKVLLVPNFIHLRMLEAIVFFGTFNTADFF